MLPLVMLLRRPRAACSMRPAPGAPAAVALASLGVSPNTLMVLLCVAGVACCVAMAMPQVHIVAYCGDLGYGPARGAEMLSMMLGFGIVSRIAAGFVADRIGGLWTLLIGSALQGVGAVSLSAVRRPRVALRDFDPVRPVPGRHRADVCDHRAQLFLAARRPATRLGIVLMATLAGMALGGWLSGLIFDLTGSYQAAFLNGLAWNFANVAIVLWLLLRPRQRLVPA